MDNLKSPAYSYVDHLTPSYEDQNNHFGFTKLELASLMIAQGICSETQDRGTKFIAERSVELAKAVLAEANK
jgi:hypothetical protein